jgi:hypothetical protein
MWKRRLRRTSAKRNGVVYAITILAVAVACILLTVVLARFALSIQKAVVQDNRMTESFVPDPTNKTTLSVRGWTRGELDQMLGDFRKGYDLPDTSDWTVEAKSGDIFTVAFPQDIQPKFFLFLVNYVRYPKNFDLANRLIGVLGRVVLTAAYGVPDPALIGKQAEIYVPADDDQYDEVYARVDHGAAYRISFTNLIWQPVREARAPAEIVGL